MNMETTDSVGAPAGGWGVQAAVARSCPRSSPLLRPCPRTSGFRPKKNRPETNSPPAGPTNTTTTMTSGVSSTNSLLATHGLGAADNAPLPPPATATAGEVRRSGRGRDTGSRAAAHCTQG